MSIGYWALLLPATQLLTALWLTRTIQWRRYRTLIPALMLDAAASTAQAMAPASIRVWIACQCVWLPLKFAQAVEVFKISCEPVDGRRRYVLLCGVSVAAAIMFLTVAWWCLWEEWDTAPWLTAFRSLLMIRQYWYLELSAALVALWFIRLRYPAIEGHQHKAFRTVITLQIVRVFLGSAFVKGGIGYAVFRWDMSTWRHADVALWAAAIGLTVLQGVWMTWHYSSRDRVKQAAACSC